MGTLPSARALMGVSLAFHMVYAALAIGMPVLLLLAEGLALRTGEEGYHVLARRWVRSVGVLFAIGAVSGTILSFELGLLWPEFMRFAGGIIGMPFSLEGFAFFVEAIFLGLYLYGEGRLSRRAQFLVTVPIAVAAAASAVFVISANAWMNTPQGFTLVDGQVVNVDPWRAMFNPAMPYQAVHGTLAAYVATGFAAAGVYAFYLLRGHVTTHNQRALTLALALASVVLPLMLVSGDLSARFLARQEPAKFAAMEALLTTQAGAPLHIGGWPDSATGDVKYSVAIPKLLSFLTYGDPNAVVQGLSDMPPGTTPDPRPVHLFFDLMVGSFFAMLTAAVWFWWLYWRRRAVPTSPWPLRAVLVASPLGFVALQAGWMVTEFGRQPWVVVGYMRVSQGVTPRSGIDLVFLLFMLVYAALTAGLLWLLLHRGGPDGQAVATDLAPHRRADPGGGGMP
jgi:cytochrome d ubiquinol oxidase subunit I